MKRSIFLVSALILLVGIGYFFTRPKLAGDPPLPEVEIHKTISRPEILLIPSINVKAKVIALGKDSKGRMAIPTNGNDVGWYALGYRPGQLGSAVIAGHLDNRDGSKAVFYNLELVKVGDEIKVIDEQGKEYVFVVQNIGIYKYDEVPLEQVFNTYGKATLNLITCSGEWVNSNYTKRIVIYSTAK